MGRGFQASFVMCMIKGEVFHMALVAGLYAIILTIILLIIWKFISRYDVKPFVIGALCFFISALVLESLFHSLVLGMDTPISRAINNSTFLYVLYGSLTAGVFEEVGRLIGFKYFLRNDNKKEASIMYGIGHGGIEAIMLVGVPFVLYWAILKGLIPVDATTEMQLKPILSSLTSFQIIMTMLERTYALFFHIALSIIVFISVHHKSRFVEMIISQSSISGNKKPLLSRQKRGEGREATNDRYVKVRLQNRGLFFSTGIPASQ